MGNKIFELEIRYCFHIPKIKDSGILYISKEFGTAIHLCACGCGIETVTPLDPNEWRLTENNGKVTLKPSIGNFSWQHPYHAHYYITDNKIDWL